MAAPNIVITDLSANANLGKYLVTLPVTLLTLTSANQFTIRPKHKGRLLSTRYHAHTPGTGAGASVVITPAIGGVDVTGGVMTLTLASTDTRAEQTAGTAITQGNAFTATQDITLTAAVGTAFTAGSGMIELELVNDDSANAMAAGSFGLRTPNP